jgi:glycosyltransferase involved in cell wall biosynthesis
MAVPVGSFRPLRLLFVIHYPIFGGPHNQALRLNASLAARGWETLVLLPDEPGNALERLRAGGIQVKQMPLHRFRASPDLRLHAAFLIGFWQEVNAIRVLIRERQVDLVLIAGLVNPHAAIAARLERVPVVWQIVDSRTPRVLRLPLMPVVAQLADAVMFTGQSLVDLHVGRRPLDLPFVVYYPPVDTDHFCISEGRRCRTRKALGIPGDSLVVGMVANLNPQKGIEYFIRAASSIYRSQPNTWFLIVGARYETHREYVDQIETEVQQSGIPRERFIFTGDRSDVENYYPAMDVKLITSVPRSEGATTTAMEAMACGRPVVATDVGAVCEVVEDGVTGFIVPPLDSAAIAHAAFCLLQDPDLRTRMGRAGRLRAMECFDVKVCADTHVQAFEVAIVHHQFRNKGYTKGDEG